MEYPYNVYGGLQDNNSWMAPSRKPGGISNRDWKLTGFGDGFWSFVDPTDADIVFSEYQGGNLLRFRKSTGEIKDIKPYAREGEAKYRFNWNTPIHLSPTQPGTMYYGAQFLFRSKDRGDSWERLSPDLTTNDPAKQKQEESGGLTADNSTAENHCTIFAIAESPKDARLIWVGTDDGNLQLTRDGGKTWTNVGLNLPGLPKNTWVSSVEASRFDAATALATFDGHMTGDMKPYVYRTTDYGATWTALATADLKGYAHIVRQDRVNPNLLFLGTESGLFVSLDAGVQWGQFTGGFPSVAVRDIVIHPRDHDVVLATHGRGVWIIDDITPLRQLTPKILDSEVAFLESRPSTLVLSGFEGRSDGDGEYTAPSPDDTAGIAYYLKKRHMFGDLKLEIYDAKGNKVSSFTGGKRRGLNRVDWPMRLPPPRIPAATSLVGHPGAFTGPRVPEGTYTVKLIKGKDTFTSELKLLPDPRSKSSPADRALQQ
jgi:hypothetical protein